MSFSVKQTFEIWRKQEALLVCCYESHTACDVTEHLLCTQSPHVFPTVEREKADKTVRFE